MLNQVDLDNHENGHGVDELRAHVFLEKFDEVQLPHLLSYAALFVNSGPRVTVVFTNNL